MNLCIESSKSSKQFRRLLLLASVAFFTVAGCEKSATHVNAPISPSDEFSDERGRWQHSDSEPSKIDNQRIGSFFKKRPDLVGSPDWTGRPEKYVSHGARSLARYYWFSGSNENPTWNALEFDGSRIRKLSGSGIPGSVNNN